MNSEFRRAEDDPFTKKFKLVIWGIGQIGVPTAVLAAILWMFNTTLKDQAKRLDQMVTTINTGFVDLKDAVKEQNRILRRRAGISDIASDTYSRG